MEHLLGGNREAPIVVPYLCSEGAIFQPEDFDRYPERHGWDFSLWREHDAVQKGIDLPAWLKANDKSGDEFLISLQSWLFFTLLASSIETLIATDDFRRSGQNGEKLLTTKHLEKYLKKHDSQVVKNCSTARKQSMLADFTAIITTAQDITYKLFQTIVFENPPCIDALREIHFSVALLIRALTATIRPLLDGGAVIGRSGMGRLPLLEERMLHEG